MNQSDSKAGRPRTRVAVFACIVIVALALDQLTKWLAETFLPARGSLTVIPGVLSLTLVHNPGASLGLGSNMTWLISLLACVACVVLLVLAWRTTSLWWTVCLALAFTGALGNLIDRIVHADGFLNGKVVDFLDYGWSVGNVADVYLMVAAVGIIVLVLCNVPFHARPGDAGRDGASDATTGRSAA